MLGLKLNRVSKRGHKKLMPIYSKWYIPLLFSDFKIPSNARHKCLRGPFMATTVSADILAPNDARPSTAKANFHTWRRDIVQGYVFGCYNDRIALKYDR